MSLIGKELHNPIGFCSHHFHPDSSEATENMANTSVAVTAKSEVERYWQGGRDGPNLTVEI